MDLPFLKGRPRDIGLINEQFVACPSSPNCVCSDHQNLRHWIEPLRLATEPAAAWSAIKQEVRNLARVRIISNGDSYLHAECRSRLLGFVDDLQLHLRPEEGIVAVRSASRLGYSDLGVNRHRVEKLRALLQKQNIVR